MKFIISHIEDWDVVAKALVEQLKPGMAIKLTGPLGAGKTTLVQALAKALGAKGVPRSPTFSLMRTYQVGKKIGIKRLVHIDAYRLESSSDAHALGLDEELTGNDTVLVVEWAEKLGTILNAIPSIQVKIEADPSGVRRVSVV
jgi:tRNA threonylcarbamoyladenosine biosynthesis protein TsaE